MRYGIPSRFLDEIPEALLKRLNSKPVARAGSNSNNFIVPKVAAIQNSAYPFKIGQGVRHAKFGEGVVIGYEGNAASLVIKINFGRDGIKSLAMEYAKLEKI